MPKLCPSFLGGFSQVGFNLDRPEQSVEVVMQMAQVPEEGRNLVGGLGAVRTGIALFWATKATPCTVCKSCKPA